MPLPNAPASISLNQVNVELGRSGTATISLNETAVRTLFGVPSGQISMSQGYGKANFWKSNLTKGFWSGGANPGGLVTADRITYSTETRTAVSGANLSQARSFLGAAGNADKGFFCGGNPALGTTDRTTYSSESTAAVPGANLSPGRGSSAGAGNAEKGFLAGGQIPGVTAISGKITYSSEAYAAVTGANLSQARFGAAATGNSDKGFFSGGCLPSPFARVVTADKITYSTETRTAVSGANLTITRNNLGAAGNADKGFFSGGSTPILRANADRTTYSSETTAAVPGANLSQGRETTGAGNADKGFFAGSYTTGVVTTADRTTYSSETTAAVPGANLSQARFGVVAV